MRHRRRRTGQPPVTSVIAKRLRLFGHLARADPSQDHSRILRAAINRPPAGWRRRAGRPRRTWLRTIELDLQPHNLGLNTAWMRVQDRSKWRQHVETSKLTDGCAARWLWLLKNATSTWRKTDCNNLAKFINIFITKTTLYMHARTHHYSNNKYYIFHNKTKHTTLECWCMELRSCSIVKWSASDRSVLWVGLYFVTEMNDK